MEGLIARLAKDDHAQRQHHDAFHQRAQCTFTHAAMQDIKGQGVDAGIAEHVE